MKLVNSIHIYIYQFFRPISCLRGLLLYKLVLYKLLYGCPFYSINVNVNTVLKILSVRAPSLDQKMISWYQEIEFLISENKVDFFISKIRFLDIKKSFFWYQEIEYLISENHFLISKIRILDIRNWIFDIKKWFVFSDIRKSIFWYQKVRPI